tara:strand:- start:71 stop:370 length:300 start_codon:yes stop_codon:yes gene_type:complete
MNPEEDFGVVDLHGLCKWGARYMFQSYLNTIHKGLYKGWIHPNYGSIHYVKVIAGAGWHTAGGKDKAVLKNMVCDFLKYGKYVFLSEFEKGVFLIKLEI